MYIYIYTYKARAVAREARETLLNHDRNERHHRVEDRLVLNLTYHPLLRYFQKVLNERQILLTPNEKHKSNLREKPLMIAWSKARNLKDYLIMVKITNRDTEASEVA